MENLAQLAPLIILFPSIGAFINIFWGARLGERLSAIIGTVASALTFVIALLLFTYLVNNGFTPAVVNPPLLDTWIRIPSANVEIGWQQRVDTLSVTMMLFVTFVGTLIHVYASGYMHGDARFPRFFAYLNMFLAFMLTLITGNNFLMMFVGWEGVGLCSFLLIGFWWDKAHGVGWRNSLAARKAFIVNRVGDFGLMLGIFLIFWTFGTLDYYRPGEIANPGYDPHHAEASEAHSEGAVGEAAEGEHAEEGAAAEGEHAEEAAAEGEHTEEAAAGEAHSEAAEGEHSETIAANNDAIPTEQLGVFGQAERMLEEGREVHFGPFTLPIETVITLITLFLLVGATGKSAQIPLFVWLPDAMAGPTPVSALIHAATMVTAGVYMMVRSNVFYYNAELTSFIVTLIGISTALIAGFIAVGQWDIKRVLAYSTISQLGFMVAAVGIGAYAAAMFHMITHAFFKALLFLGSGSVIHGVEHGHHHAHAHGGGGHGHDDHGHAADAHHEEESHAPHDDFDPQDMRNMGGLSKRMPITYWTYLIGTLALAGLYPLAGFWSKDEILADAAVRIVEGGTPLETLGGILTLGVLLLAAGFTAFYMWRQVELVFHGAPRSEAAEHAPESVRTMTIPLIILAVCTVFMGFINIPGGAGLFGLGGLGLQPFLGEHALTAFLGWSVSHVHTGTFNLLLAIVATAVGLGAIFVSRGIYGNNKGVVNSQQDTLQTNPVVRPLWNLANARMYWDQFYFAVIENPFNKLSQFLANTIDWDFWHNYFHDSVITKGFNGIGNLLSKPVDLGLIDATVLGFGRVARWFSGLLRRGQTGYVRTYAIVFLLGVVVLLAILLLPLLQASAAQ